MKTVVAKILCPFRVASLGYVDISTTWKNVHLCMPMYETSPKPTRSKRNIQIPPQEHHHNCLDSALPSSSVNGHPPNSYFSRKKILPTPMYSSIGFATRHLTNAQILSPNWQWHHQAGYMSVRMATKYSLLRAPATLSTSYCNLNCRNAVSCRICICDAIS